jgi:RNA polymerase sigma-70 factor, ECF subfamily
VPRPAQGEGGLLPAPSEPDVTQLLLAWRAGDDGALARLVPLVYGELRRLAHHCRRGEHPDQTLQTTALVNEAYVRLVGAQTIPWQNRAHFLAVCAHAMRHILVDAGRSRRSSKRGGDAIHVQLEEWFAAAPGRPPDLVALDDALTELAAVEPRRSQVVELRYFGGLSVEETAEVLGLSRQTVIRDWNAAKLWLLRALDRTASAAAKEGP